MTGAGDIAVKIVEWSAAQTELRAVRHAVFVVEQHVPEDLEWDDMDARSTHALALAPDGTPIGCGRLLPTGYIGRMAVLAPWRSRGVGAALLIALVDLARERGYARASLNAQVRAMPFYARHGFVATGEQFDEAGIDHRVMARNLHDA